MNCNRLSLDIYIRGDVLLQQGEDAPIFRISST